MLPFPPGSLPPGPWAALAAGPGCLPLLKAQRAFLSHGSCGIVMTSFSFSSPPGELLQSRIQLSFTWSASSIRCLAGVWTHRTSEPLTAEPKASQTDPDALSPELQAWL